MLELRRGDRRQAVDVGGEHIHGTPQDECRLGSVLQDRSIRAVVDALRSGEEPELGGRIGLNIAEILFAGYESARSRKRVDLPLQIDDNPLEQMVESGALSPRLRSIQSSRIRSRPQSLLA